MARQAGAHGDATVAVVRFRELAGLRKGDGAPAPATPDELTLIGVAAGGVPVNYTDVLRYIDGSSDWSGAIPAVTLGLLRGYHIDPARFLNAHGMQIAAEVQQGCLNPTAYPGLKLEDILKPQYRDYAKVPTIVRIFNDSIMGRGSTPTEPMLLGVGNADGTGDGVMVARDVQQLAYDYCRRGVNVQFHEYAQSNHDEAAPQFEAQALPFLEQLYASQPVPSGCAQITPGNPLAPLPVPAGARAHTRLTMRVLGLSARRHRLTVVLFASGGTLRRVAVTVRRGHRVLARTVVATLRGRRRVGLRSRVGALRMGRYRVLARAGRLAVGRTFVVSHRSRARSRRIDADA